MITKKTVWTSWIWISWAGDASLLQWCRSVTFKPKSYKLEITDLIFKKFCFFTSLAIDFLCNTYTPPDDLLPIMNLSSSQTSKKKSLTTIYFVQIPVENILHLFPIWPSSSEAGLSNPSPLDEKTRSSECCHLLIRPSAYFKSNLH